MRWSALVFPSHGLHIKVCFTRPSDFLKSCAVCSQCAAAAAALSPQKNISLMLFNYSLEVMFQVSQNPNISPSSCLSAYVNRAQQAGSRRCLFTQRERSEHTHSTPRCSSAEALRQLTLKPWFPVGVLQWPCCMLCLLLLFPLRVTTAVVYLDIFFLDK